MENVDPSEGAGSSSFPELASVIQNLAEVYGRIKGSKQRMVKQRKGDAKGLELQQINMSVDMRWSFKDRSLANV